MDDRFDGPARFFGDSGRAWAVFDRDMRYIEASPKWLTDYRVTGPVIGRSHYEVFPDIGENRKAVHRRCLAGATERCGGERFERSGGVAQWIAWEVRPWRDKDGAIGGIVIASEDITARVEAQDKEKLRKAVAGLSAEMQRVMGAQIVSVRYRLTRSERELLKLRSVSRNAASAAESGGDFRDEDARPIAEATDRVFEWIVESPTPREGEAPRHATVSAQSAGAAPSPAPVHDDRIRPQEFSVGEGLPKAIASVWRVRLEGSAPSDQAVGGLDATRLRPSATFLHVPDAAILSGARAPAYRWIKGKPENGRVEFLLSLVLQGRRRFEQMGRDVEGGAGSAAFASSVEGGQFSFGAEGRYLGVNLPAQPLQERVSNVESRLIRPIDPDSPPLRLLSAYVSSLMKSQEGLDREVARSVAEHFVDLCALMLGAKGDERALAQARGLRAAQKAAICEAIDAGAATPGFSAQTVADQLGLSPRYVHFLLEEGGAGFGRLVNERRLEIARARLAYRRFDGMTIPELAFACGFADLPKFHREFSARFGEAPSAFRAGRSVTT